MINYEGLAHFQEKKDSVEPTSKIEEKIKEFIERAPENQELMERQMNVRQHPEGYDDILKEANNEEGLKNLMVEKGIKKIVHSEGLTVWDHTKKALELLESRDDIAEEKKKELRLLIFYHDLGKISASRKEENKKETEKQIGKGVLNCVMRGHHREGLDAIREGMIANDVDGEDLKIYMNVIENHMNTSLLEQGPKKLVKLFENFGDTEDERRRVVDLLSLVLEVDGSATENITMKDNGELLYSKNEKKLKINSDDLWEKYEEGKKMIGEEERLEEEKAKQKELEEEIFPGGVAKYLAEERGVPKGKNFGEAMKRTKEEVQKNKNLSPEKIREIIDALDVEEFKDKII